MITETDTKEIFIDIPSVNPLLVYHTPLYMQYVPPKMVHNEINVSLIGFSFKGALVSSTGVKAVQFWK